MAAAFSAIINVGLFVFPEVMVGIMLASATCKPWTVRPDPSKTCRFGVERQGEEWQRQTTKNLRKREKQKVKVKGRDARKKLSRRKRGAGEKKRDNEEAGKEEKRERGGGCPAALLSLVMCAASMFSTIISRRREKEHGTLSARRQRYKVKRKKK